MSTLLGLTPPVPPPARQRVAPALALGGASSSNSANQAQPINATPVESDVQIARLVNDVRGTNTQAANQNPNLGNNANPGNGANQPQRASLNNIINPQLREKYARLGTRGSGLVQKTDWMDIEIETRDHLKIFGYQENTIEEKLNVIKIGLESLYKSVSAQSVSMILAGAWLLESPENEGKYVFKDLNIMGNAVSVDTLSSRVLAEGNGTANLDGIEGHILLKEGAYLCASVLRMITKESNNLRTAWPTIKRNYNNFYQQEMELEIEPDPECLDQIRLLLQNRLIIRQTIGMFLLNMKDLAGQDLGICRMLFEIHLCYAGMHAFSLLLYCVANLKVPLQVFFQILEHPHHSEALKMAETLLREYVYPIGAEEIANASIRSTWKYARLFDSTAFSSLQTKNCTQLTAILAIVAQKVGVRNSGDATHIRQISNLIRADTGWLTSVSDRIIEYCRSGKYANPDEISGFKNYNRAPFEC